MLGYGGTAAAVAVHDLVVSVWEQDVLPAESTISLLVPVFTGDIAILDDC